MPYLPVLNQVPPSLKRPIHSSVSEVGAALPAWAADGIQELVDLESKIREIERFESQQLTFEFFPSSTWLSSYVKAWPVGAKAYSFKQRLTSSNQFAYAFASLGVRRSRLGWMIRSLSLNEAPAGVLADVHIEKNGFVGLDRKLAAEPLSGFIQSAVGRKDEWDEIRLNSIDDAAGPAIQALAAKYDLICFQTYSAPSYLIDFAQVLKAHQGDYLLSRSTNTRSQIRQSTRRIEKEFGPINVREASSVDEAHEWFDRLANWHRQRWNRNGESNNFNDQGFADFLKSQVDLLLPVKRLSLVRIAAGEKTLALYYYFMYGDRVYFYLGGVDYTVPSSLRPGLVSHYWAAQNFFQNGIMIYDFMEGASRYKASLSTTTSVNQGWVLQRRTKFLVAEQWLRGLKQWFLRKTRVGKNMAQKDSHV
jgi:Acetyltransferase (GNAT) domain